MLRRRTRLLGRLANLLPLLATLYIIGYTCMPAWHGYVYASLDHNAFTLPMRIAWSIAIGEGEWGHWSPWVWRGMSLLGKGEAGTLHPLQWLAFRTIPIDVALRLWQVSAMPLAAAGMWWLLRRVYRMEPLATCAGMGFYAVSSFYTANFGMTHMTLILAHTPWAVGVTERLLSGRPTRRGLWAAALGLLYGSMFLLGHPQMVWFVSLAVGWIMVDRGMARRWDRPWRVGMGYAIAAIAAGLAIGLVQILPTLAELAQTARGAMTNDARNNFSAHPVHLLQNAFPNLFKEKIVGDTFILPDGGSVYMNNPSDYAVYFGTPLLAWCWLGLVSQRRRLLAPPQRWRTALALGLLLAMTWLMLGRYGGLNTLVGYVPLLRDFSSPSRHKAVIAFILALWGARLIHLQLRQSRDAAAAASLLRRTPFGGVLTVAPFVLWCLAIIFLAWRVDAITLNGRAHAIQTGKEVFLPMLITYWILWFLLQLGRHQRLTARVGALTLPALAAAFIVLDLGAFGMSTVRGVPYKSVADIRAADAAMRRPQTLRVHLDSPRDFWNYGEPWWQGRLQTLGFVGSLIPVERFNYRTENQLRVASVASVIDARGRTADAVANPLPRVRLARVLRQEDNPITALDALKPEQVADTALTREPLDVFASLNGPPLDPAAEHATLVSDHFDVLTMDVAVTSPRLLVVSDRFAPGWTATVDGTARPLLPLFAGMMRGVRLQPGDTQVVMRYQPPGFHRGLAFAATGLALLLILAALGFRRRRA